jgi:ubiquinone/menaquinone biosynthesis C-methylase UbiE
VNGSAAPNLPAAGPDRQAFLAKGGSKSEKAIEIARRTLKQDDIRFLVMNAEDLDFENESFDTVNISASLHHVANIQPVLDEMVQVLKPRGISSSSRCIEMVKRRQS